MGIDTKRRFRDLCWEAVYCEDRPRLEEIKAALLQLLKEETRTLGTRLAGPNEPQPECTQPTNESVTDMAIDPFTKPSGQNRRRYPRVKAQVSLEIHTSENSPPLRLSTAEVSLGGCYVETMFTLDLGTKVVITLWLNEQPIRATSIVATRFAQIGNGFEFVEMSPEDRSKLDEFISGLLQKTRAATQQG